MGSISKFVAYILERKDEALVKLRSMNFAVEEWREKSMNIVLSITAERLRHHFEKEVLDFNDYRYLATLIDFLELETEPCVHNVVAVGNRKRIVIAIRRRLGPV